MNTRLIVNVNPAGSGTITIDPVKTTYHYGDVVTLTATAAPGWTFSNWSGDASGNENPLTVTIHGNANITGTFTQDEYALIVNVSPAGSGTITIDPVKTTYHYGDVVTLTATADPGWTFSNWSGDASGNENPLTVTIHGNANITGTFTQDEYTLSVDVSPAGSGTVTIDPVKTTYHYGDVVTLTATADPGWTFSNWSGDASGNENPLTVRIKWKYVYRCHFHSR